MDSESRRKAQSLVIGTLGIYITYCLASILQQYIIDKSYYNWRTGTHDNLQSTNSFVLIPSLVAWVTGIMCNAGTQKRKQLPFKNLLYCGLLTALTSLCLNKAIYVTNFPIVMMFKSCNILSVIAVSLFCSRVKEKSQRLGSYQLKNGGLITFGLILYYVGGNQETKLALNPFGLLLLVVSLLCDGFLPDFQAQLKTKYKPTALQMFEGMNKWRFIVSVFYSLLFFQAFDMLNFYIQHPTCLFDLVMLSSLGSLGQIIVFWMIKQFRQQVVPFIITTRKLTTTVLSIIFFKHQLRPIQLFAIILTFSVVIYDFYRQINHQVKVQLDSLMPKKSDEKTPILYDKQQVLDLNLYDSFKQMNKSQNSNLDILK